MCGIFAIINNQDYDIRKINDNFMLGKNRGPESSQLMHLINSITFGFHRLAINGLNDLSNQPFNINGVYLICNGEIYNHHKLFKSIKTKPVTESDCEIIIHLYLKYGIKQTLIMLDGVFSFVLYDTNINKIFIARDPLGVRPLFILQKLSSLAVASDLKCLKNYILNDNNTDDVILTERSINIAPRIDITQFEPGHYAVYDFNSISSQWDNKTYYINYYNMTFPYKTITDYHDDTEFENYFKLIQNSVLNSVNKRRLNTERPIACLLSGGLDSSLVAALVCNCLQTQIETYSIGLEGSEDVKYAEIVAKYIDSKHTSVVVTEEDMFNAIPEVIRAIESYDTTTVRASIGNYLISKYISNNSDAKVIFNGDGSDELFGGYLYMHACPDDIEFDKETRRLLQDIHYFDVLRSDKSISSNGLEPRTPFLDRSLVNNVLSIPAYFRNHNNFKKIEKYLLREAFASFRFKDYLGRQILPDEVLYRKKEAFSDGVTGKKRSLFQIIQEKIALEKGGTPSIELEKEYYLEIFKQNFGETATVTIPYYWMPKYTLSNDPSARTLKIYE